MIDALEAVGRAAGLDAVGVAAATPFERTREDLERREAAGLAAGMQFTYRNPARSTEPARALPGARALVVGARSYAHEGDGRPGGPAAGAGRPTGRVARYARHDHYAARRDGLDAVAAAGATAVVQPGGSVRDQEVIAAADEHGLAMVFTGRRHFRH